MTDLSTGRLRGVSYECDDPVLQRGGEVAAAEPLPPMPIEAVQLGVVSAPSLLESMLQTQAEYATRVVPLLEAL